MVPACSIRGNPPDSSCILKPGDHPFIQQDSYIAYRHWRIEPAKWLANGVSTTYLIDKGLMEQAVFERVLKGLSVSPFVASAAISFLNEVDAAEQKK
jgi:hypothetical protein